MSLFDAIQNEYPDPVSAQENDGLADCYCIGGAVVLYAARAHAGVSPEAFPDPETLARVLRLLNDDLPTHMAHYMAHFITDHNDAGDFDLAWELVEEALDYAP